MGLIVKLQRPAFVRGDLFEKGVTDKWPEDVPLPKDAELLEGEAPPKKAASKKEKGLSLSDLALKSPDQNKETFSEMAKGTTGLDLKTKEE